MGVEPFAADGLSEPGWLSDAPRVELETAAQDRLLALDHTGGPAVESGTDLTVTAGGERLGTVALPSAVEPGEAVYVYRTGDGSLEVSVGERPTIPDDATAFTGDVLVTGTQGRVTFRAGAETGGE